MRKNVLVAALVGLALPAMALATQPLLIRVDGRTVPMREIVQVMQTAAGPVRIRTWSWRGPDGAATFQVSESRNASPGVPAWALAQMSALQAQMRQLQAMLVQPLLMRSVPQPVAFGPLLLLPGRVPLEVRLVQPMMPLPARVLVLLPGPAPHARPASPPRVRGRLT